MSSFLDFIKNSSPLFTVLQIGFIAGILDILAAFTNLYLSSGRTPRFVLQYVASGVFGKASFTGGTSTMLWGLLFHFLISLSWAALFFLLYPILSKFSPNWIFNGIVYGIIVWLMMTLLILPNTNAPVPPFQFNQQAVINMLIIIVCIGLPISWMVSHWYAQRLGS